MHEQSEAVILGVDGVPDFDALHSGKHNEEVQLYAFDMLAGDGDDMRSLPLSMRKTNLARLLARRDRRLSPLAKTLIANLSDYSLEPPTMPVAG